MPIGINISDLRTPCYIVDERLLIKNLKILKNVIDSTGCKILLAQKGFSMFHTYPLIGEYLDGTTASSLFEAKLGYESMKENKYEGADTKIFHQIFVGEDKMPMGISMGKETHIFAPAYLESEFDEISDICGHIVFNSFSQWNKYKNIVVKKGKKAGIRINPELSTQDRAIYDPCSKFSRLGVTLDNFEHEELDGISGLHFHTLCEQNSDALEKTLEAVERKFGKYLYQMEWLNFGGGHHITRHDYDIEKLKKCITKTKEKYNLDIYLEPGEAVALNIGFLAASVLDIINNGMNIAILDTSAACHNPDVLEMPYRPNIIGAGEVSEKKYTYRLGGNTCLAGDIIGDYSFDKPLKSGDKLIFTDMAHYTMVKNNTFNGINLPDIVYYSDKKGVEIVKQFGYNDFKSRLS